MVTYLYQLEIGCQEDLIDSQSERLTTDKDVEGNETLSTKNQRLRGIVEAPRGGQPHCLAAVKARDLILRCVTNGLCIWSLCTCLPVTLNC